jgi:hypothetical protein
MSLSNFDIDKRLYDLSKKVGSLVARLGDDPRAKTFGNRVTDLYYKVLNSRTNGTNPQYDCGVYYVNYLRSSKEALFQLSTLMEANEYDLNKIKAMAPGDQILYDVATDNYSITSNGTKVNLNFYFKPYTVIDPTCVPNNLILDEFDLLDKFYASLSTSEFIDINALRTEFTNQTATINTILTQGDYSSIYRLTNEMINSIMQSLVMLRDINGLNININKNIPDISRQYQLMLRPEDLVVGIPTDMNDLVSLGDWMTSIKSTSLRMNTSYQMTNTDLLDLLNTSAPLAATPENVNVDAAFNQMRTMLQSQSNIATNNPNIKILMDPTIDSMTRTVMSLTPDQKADRLSAIKVMQDQYLQIIINGELGLYEALFPAINDVKSSATQIGGKKSKYQLTLSNSKKMSTTQSGGDVIDPDVLYANLRTQQDTVQKIIASISSNKSKLDQVDAIFSNADITGEQLYARNRYLTDITYLYLMGKLTVSSSDTSYVNTMKSLQVKMSQYASTLNTFYNLIANSDRTGIPLDNSVIRDYINSGLINANDVRATLLSSGLMSSTPGVTSTDPTQVYNSLNSYYSEVANLISSMDNVRNQIRTGVTNLKQLKDNVGVVIEQNLLYIIGIIDALIATNGILQDSLSDTLQLKLWSEQVSIRMDEMHVYLKAKSNVISNANATISQYNLNSLTTGIYSNFDVRKFDSMVQRYYNGIEQSLDNNSNAKSYYDLLKSETRTKNRMIQLYADYNFINSLSPQLLSNIISFPISNSLTPMIVTMQHLITLPGTLNIVSSMLDNVSIPHYISLLWQYFGFHSYTDLQEILRSKAPSDLTAAGYDDATIDAMYNTLGLYIQSDILKINYIIDTISNRKSNLSNLSNPSDAINLMPLRITSTPMTSYESIVSMVNRIIPTIQSFSIQHPQSSVPGVQFDIYDLMGPIILRNNKVARTDELQQLFRVDTFTLRNSLIQHIFDHTSLILNRAYSYISISQDKTLNDSIASVIQYLRPDGEFIKTLTTTPSNQEPQLVALRTWSVYGTNKAKIQSFITSIIRKLNVENNDIISQMNRIQQQPIDYDSLNLSYYSTDIGVNKVFLIGSPHLITEFKKNSRKFEIQCESYTVLGNKIINALDKFLESGNSRSVPVKGALDDYINRLNELQTQVMLMASQSNFNSTVFNNAISALVNTPSVPPAKPAIADYNALYDTGINTPLTVNETDALDQVTFTINQFNRSRTLPNYKLMIAAISYYLVRISEVMTSVNANKIISDFNSATEASGLHAAKFMLQFNKLSIDRYFTGTIAYGLGLTDDSSMSQVQAYIGNGDAHALGYVDSVGDFITTVDSHLLYNSSQDIKLYGDIIYCNNELKHMISKTTESNIEYYANAQISVLLLQQVMFNNEYFNTDFISKARLSELMETILDRYTLISNSVETQFIETNRFYLEYQTVTEQEVAFRAYKLALGKRIAGVEPIKLYQSMSFGLVEYYNDIVNRLVRSIEGPNESLDDIQKYFKRLHYIELKRQQKFLQWLIDYLGDTLTYENNKSLRSQNGYVSILKKKILITQCKNLPKVLFLEFNFIKDILDQYQAIYMPKISLHMRINDYATSAGDLDPYDPKYQWTNNSQVFYNNSLGRVRNNLLINFNLTAASNVLFAARQGITLNLNTELQRLENDYAQTYAMRDSGIKFERIYNSLDYPDADVISNYMSLAPNLKSFRGTIIMTYGYSGTGKSATLFGVQPKAENKYSSKNGILQTTLDQLVNEEIYLRVYELYGLGCQYDFYWNALQPGTDINIANTELFQLLIHHDLNVSGDVIRINNSYVIDNRADMLSYVMDLANLETGGKIQIKPVINADGQVMDPHPRLAPLINSSGSFIDSSYKKINTRQYQTFVNFIDGDVENARKKGIEYQKIINQSYQQIKVTVNNDVSSRSILFYDFQIKSTRSNGTHGSTSTEYYTPYIICDLPGKEDMYKTYIQPNANTIVDAKRKTAILNDLPADKKTWLGDEVKPLKSTYILNPLIMSIFNGNYQIIIDHLKSLDAILVDQQTKDIITSFGQQTYYYYDTNLSPANRKISAFYIDYTSINNFTELFDAAKLKDSLADLNGIYRFYTVPTTGDVKRKLQIYQLLLISMVQILIQKNYLDVIVNLIHHLTDWPVKTIYNIWEGYYINENVVGLLHYLVKNILGDEKQPFESQSEGDVGMYEKVKLDYELGGIYTNFEQQKNDTRIFPVNFTALKVEPFVIQDSAFAIKYRIDPDRTFLSVAANKTLAQYYDTMNAIIYKQNLGLYDSNKIYRDGRIQFPQTYANPDKTPPIINMRNNPILQDFLQPYEQKISFYYLFYVVTNNAKELKAEEQIKLLNNSMTFINILNSSSLIKKK